MKSSREIYTRTVKSIDTYLVKSKSVQNDFYEPKLPIELTIFEHYNPQIIAFDKKHHRLSNSHPLIGTHTDSDEDIETSKELLKLIHTHIIDPKHRLLLTAEALCKVIAYRSLKEGMTLQIPCIDANNDPVLVAYSIDHVFDLWKGIPAYGLVPESKGNASPILLFRGTVVSTSKPALASMISDLDPSGPGYHIYKRSRDQITAWLSERASTGPKARVMGFSLGGALTHYALILDTAFINTDKKHPSITFGSPGVTLKLLKKWELIPKTERPYLYSLIHKNDQVSKIGHLFGDINQLDTEENYGPLASHSTFMLAKPKCFLIGLWLNKTD